MFPLQLLLVTAGLAVGCLAIRVAGCGISIRFAVLLAGCGLAILLGLRIAVCEQLCLASGLSGLLERICVTLFGLYSSQKEVNDSKFAPTLADYKIEALSNFQN